MGFAAVPLLAVTGRSTHQHVLEPGHDKRVDVRPEMPVHRHPSRAKVASMPMPTAIFALSPISSGGFMKTKRTRIRMSDVRLSLPAPAVAGISSGVVAGREGKQSIPAKSPLASTVK